MRFKVGLKAKIGIALAATAITASGIFSSGMSIAKYSSEIDASSLNSASISAPIKGEEATEPDKQSSKFPVWFTDNLISHMAAAEKNIQAEISDVVEPKHQVSTKDVEIMIEQALPYVAKVLGTDKVYSPRLSTSNRTSGVYYGIGINIPTKHSYTSVKETVAHELIHAQYLGKSFRVWDVPKRLKEILSRHSEKSSKLNETFAEVSSLEVLARQALDGDKLAEAAFFGEIYQDLAWQSIWLKDSEKTGSYDVRYKKEPLRILHELLLGERTSYEGIKLDGTKQLLYRKMLIAANPIPKNADSDYLSKYCASDLSRLMCASATEVTVLQGKIEGDIKIWYSRSVYSAGYSSGGSHMFYSPQGKMLPIRVELPTIIEPATILLRNYGNGGIPNEIYLEVGPTNSQGGYYLAKNGLPVPGKLSRLDEVVSQLLNNPSQ